MEEIQLGHYALPVLITVILGLVYKIATVIPERLKPVISVLIGVGLGLYAIEYAEKAWTLVIITDYVLYGFMVGASAVGLYEISKAVRKSKGSNSGRGMVSMVLTICLISFGAMSISGCGAWFRETALKGVDEYTANVETEMEATRRLMKVWPYRSCQLREALGARYGSLPSDATDAWEKLDELCKKEELTQCDLGTASGTWILMTYEVVREAVKQYAPDILGLLPAFL